MARYKDWLAQPGARLVSQTDSELVIELQEELPEQAKNKEYGPGEYQVPFTGDLKPQATIARVAIRSDGTVASSDIYVLTSSGKEVLVQSERTTVEVLDQMPPGLF